MASRPPSTEGLHEPGRESDATSTSEIARDDPQDIIAAVEAERSAEGSERSAAFAQPVARIAAVVAAPVLAAAIMTGGVFNGPGARIWAGIAGLLGVALGARATRIRRPGLLYAAIIGGVFAIGLLAVIPEGLGNVTSLGRQMRIAITTSDVLRPPVDFLPGWHAILAWIMAALGFTSAWIAIELRKPALGLVVSLPVIGIGAISVPESQQLWSGLAALVLFVVGLGLLSSAQQPGEDDEPVSLAYEARRAIRAIPLIGAVTVALYFAAQSNFLFPPPLYDPAQEAKKPKSVPLSEVEDRVLFTVDAKFTGPWKMGSLDVYDGEDWRLPPFSQAKLIEVSDVEGIVNEDLPPRVGAEFTIRGLGGAVLPTLPNTVQLAATLRQGQELAFDARSGSIRISQGQIGPGFEYLVGAARIPDVEALRRTEPNPPDDFDTFLEIPDPPPAVETLLARAPGDSAWDKLDFLRTTLLESAVASGAGSPVSITPDKVQDLLAGSKRGTPFEIVAAQAMIARWAGIPSRIGYGFDGGDQAPGGLLEVRPKHGAVFLEIYYDGYGWLPIIGDPLQAQENLSDTPQQFNPTVQISDDVSVRLFIPFVQPPESDFLDQARAFALRLLVIGIVLLLVYYLWPLPYKAYRRARRRSWARDHGAPARVALAYAEWRDHCTDFGYRYTTDTPLMFLDRVVADEEHAELAWLATRSLWGDLRGELTEQDALAAEELSRSLRRRLSQTQSWVLRGVAALSRLSVRDPYAHDLDVLARGRSEDRAPTVPEEEKDRAPAPV